MASDLSYPEGDLRSADYISDKQIDRMKEHFDEVMYTLATEKQGDAKLHKGQNSWLVNQGYLPEGYYVSDTNKSRVILLIDNIKDKQYFDEDQTTYIPGYYWNVHNKYIDRDVIMINSKDWDGKLESVYLPMLFEEIHSMMEESQND